MNHFVAKVCVHTYVHMHDERKNRIRKSCSRSLVTCASAIFPSMHVHVTVNLSDSSTDWYKIWKMFVHEWISNADLLFALIRFQDSISCPLILRTNSSPDFSWGFDSETRIQLLQEDVAHRHSLENRHPARDTWHQSPQATVLRRAAAAICA